MTEPTTCNTCRTVNRLRAALTRLRVDDDGLTRDNDIRHLDHIAELTYAVLEATADADTPRDLLANRLARLTQRVISTLFRGEDGRTVVREFLLARAELIELDAEIRPDDPNRD